MQRYLVRFNGSQWELVNDADLLLAVSGQRDVVLAKALRQAYLQAENHGLRCFVAISDGDTYAVVGRYEPRQGRKRA